MIKRFCAWFQRNFGVGIYYMNYTAGQMYNFSVFNYKYYNVDYVEC